jgi:hypothetical protein
MARFSDINRADELKAAAVKLDLWRKLDATAKKAAYATATGVGGGKRANRSSKLGFIQPFGASDKIWFETKVLAPQAETDTPKTNEESVGNMVSAVLSAVAPGISATLPTGAGNISVQMKKIKLAKVRLTERTGTGADATSRMTGRPYRKFNSNTISCPFGKGGTFTGEAVARGLIGTALLVASTTSKTVGFSPQGNVKIATN